MKKRLTLLFGVGVVLLLLWWLIRERTTGHISPTFFSSEPRYGGERLSYWLTNMSRYSYQGRRINPASAEALVQIGTNALPLLLDWIARPDPSGPGIRYPQHAVEGFEILGPIAKPAIPKLIKNIGNDHGYSMRALQFIGKDAATPLAEKLLETLNDKSEPVMNWRDPRYRKNFFHIQAAVIRCLREMGTNAEAAMPALTNALNAKHGWMRDNNPYAALVSVGQNHADIVIPALIHTLTNSASPAFNRGAIAIALASFGTNQADVLLPVLIATMDDRRTDDQNRRATAGALAVVGHNHPDVVVPVLTATFTNTKTEYRDGIAAALASFGNEARPAMPELLAASQSPYFPLRMQSAVAVKKIAPETPDALAPLVRDLENSEPGFRQQAIYALGKLGTNAIEAAPALIKALSHRDSQTRIDATRCLQNIGVVSDEIIDRLGENLSNTNYFVSHETLSTLAGFADRSKLAFVTIIKKAISSPVERDVRDQAKYRLIDIAWRDATFLLQCLEDSDAGVRSGALKVFYDLARGVPESIPKLQKLTNDPDTSVRSLAADVLRLQQQ